MTPNISPNLSNHFIYDSDLAVSVADEKEPHPMILGSLKIQVSSNLPILPSKEGSPIERPAPCRQAESCLVFSAQRGFS